MKKDGNQNILVRVIMIYLETTPSPIWAIYDIFIKNCFVPVFKARSYFKIQLYVLYMYMYMYIIIGEKCLQAVV